MYLIVFYLITFVRILRTYLFIYNNICLESASPAQPYIPPSEQQVQEPRMYTGAAIPSRSFRMLQAMTGPDPSGKYKFFWIQEIILLFFTVIFDH